MPEPENLQKWRRHDATILSATAVARRSIMTGGCGVSKTLAAVARPRGAHL